jgi:hypothetical protein
MSTTGSSDKLIAAAEAVDVIDAAGRIIANPSRNAIAASAAEVLALAWATEGFNAIVIEAELLVRALALPVESFTREEQFSARDQAVQTQVDRLCRQFALLGGDTQSPTGKE